MILREFNLDQLSEHNLDNMFMGICVREWGCYVTESSWRVIDLDLTVRFHLKIKKPRLKTVYPIGSQHSSVGRGETLCAAH